MTETQHVRTWPRIPFVQPIVTSDTDPEWMLFFSAGHSFERIQYSVTRWQISALLLRLSNLEAASPCPPYFVRNSGVILELSIREFDAPTVALCIRALVVFDLLLGRWGARETAFRFGHGFDLLLSQATFEVRHWDE